MGLKKNVSRKLVAIVLAVGMVAGPVASMAESQFVDMPEGWAKEHVEKAVERKILCGDENNQVRAHEASTRAEFVSMLNRLEDFDQKGDLSKFKDLDPKAWYYEDFEKAVGAEIIAGMTETEMGPNLLITREQAFTIIARNLGISSDNDKLADYEDGDQVSEWAREAVNALIEKGYVRGHENNTLTLKANITRVETAILLMNIYDENLEEPEKPEEPGEEPEDPEEPGEEPEEKPEEKPEDKTEEEEEPEEVKIVKIEDIKTIIEKEGYITGKEIVLSDEYAELSKNILEGNAEDPWTKDASVITIKEYVKGVKGQEKITIAGVEYEAEEGKKLIELGEKKFIIPKDMVESKRTKLVIPGENIIVDDSNKVYITGDRKVKMVEDIEKFDSGEIDNLDYSFNYKKNITASNKLEREIENVEKQKLNLEAAEAAITYYETEGRGTANINVTRAKTAVRKVADKEKKSELYDSIDEIWNGENLEAAEAAVTYYETEGKRVTRARIAVGKVADEAKRNELYQRINQKRNAK